MVGWCRVTLTRNPGGLRLSDLFLRLLLVAVRLILPPVLELGLLEQALVLACQQVGVDLADRVHGHRDDDQQAGAAEEEGHGEVRNCTESEITSRIPDGGIPGILDLSSHTWEFQIGEKNYCPLNSRVVATWQRV